MTWVLVRGKGRLWRPSWLVGKLTTRSSPPRAPDLKFVEGTNPKCGRVSLVRVAMSTLLSCFSPLPASTEIHHRVRLPYHPAALRADSHE